jgi:hypothetical protein
MSPTELKMQPTIHQYICNANMDTSICFFILKNIKHSQLFSFVNFDINVIFAW